MKQALAVGAGIVALLAAGATAAAPTTAWRLVPSPRVAQGELLAVSADSASDVWAVGERFDVASGNYRTLVEHYDGVGWRVVRSRNPLAQDWQKLGADKKIIVGICAILVGGFGVHKFILGYTNEGIIQLLLGLACGIGEWPLWYLPGNSRPADPSSAALTKHRFDCRD